MTIARKTEMTRSGLTVRDRSGDQPILDYSRMTADEIVDHFIDENGLAPFIDTQQKGIPADEWNWRAITLHVQMFSRGYLTFSPEYLRDLYAIQKERIAAAMEVEAA